MFTSTKASSSASSDDLFWALLAQFNAGDMSGVTETLAQIDANGFPTATAGFELRVMDGLAQPFAALSTDIAASIWALRGETAQLLSHLDRLRDALPDGETLDDCYPAQLLRRLLDKPVVADHFVTTDRLAPDLSDLFENPLEHDAPFEGALDDIFQRSKTYVLSYNGNFLFDVLALLEEVQAGPEAFDSVIASAQTFRQEILSGAFASLEPEAKIGTLGFLLPIYPKVFISDKATADALWDAALNLIPKR